jgi:serine/threonine protein kinase
MSSGARVLRTMETSNTSGAQVSDFFVELDIDYESVERISKRGDNSTLRKAHVKDSNQSVVLKTSKIGDQTSREFEVLPKLEHPNIIPLLSFGRYRGKHTLVFPYAFGGDLCDYISNSYEPLTENDTRVVVRVWCEVLKYVHSKGYFHGDVKPDNCLIYGDLSKGEIWIADFGYADKCGNFSGGEISSRPYRPPEVERAKIYTKASDMFSLGALLYVCWTGELLYPEGYDEKITECQIRDNIKSLRPDAILSEDAMDFIIMCLQRKPEKRPTAAGALEHKWLNSPRLSCFVGTSPGESAT